MTDITEELAALRRQVDKLSTPSPVFTMPPKQPPEPAQWSKELADRGAVKHAAWVERERQRQARVDAEAARQAPKLAKRDAEAAKLREQIQATQVETLRLQEELRLLYGRPL